MFKKVRLFAMVLTLAMGWSHIGHAADKTIEVAVNVNDYPFGFIDDNNKISGYDGELLQLIEKILPGINSTLTAFLVMP